MRKVPRYFEKSEEDDQKKASKKQSKRAAVRRIKETNDVITYNVKLEMKRKKSVGKGGKVQKAKNKLNPKGRYPSRKPIDPNVLQKHSRGTGLRKNAVKTGILRKKYAQKEAAIKSAHETAARLEILLTEQTGYLEADDGETTTQFTQKQIASSVDISAASKHFELRLNDFGPYRMKYTRNGRHLLLAGMQGHVAAVDWVSKKLHCELNVMETLHDISWLHIETMFAAAQKDWVYIYDNQGIELHCIKRLNKVNRMEFLPYHFLLSTASDDGYLSWLDISIGQLISKFNTRLGSISMLSQNPYNAVLCVGHAKGVVSMWSPNCEKALASMLCHKASMTALHVDPKGTYLATAATNNEVKIWDVRKLEGPLQAYKLYAPATNLSFSQKNMLAISMGNVVEVYRDCCTTTAKKPYLRHRFNNTIGNLNFCPFEDVLGVATSKGFVSLLVPGSGEANFDAFELNPYQTKSQRREYEVKSLLEKIPPDLICLEPSRIANIDVPSLQEKMEMKKKLLYLKPPKINYESRNKAKGKGGSANMARNKKIVQGQAKKEFIKNMKQIRDVGELNRNEMPGNAAFSVLDRFLPKKK